MVSGSQQVTPLSGPYPLLELPFWTKSHTPGVFVLRKNGGKVERLGVSKTDVRSEIERVAQETGSDEFFVEYAFSEARLFFLSCVLFHAYQLSTVQKHPEPAGTTHHCPIDGCRFL